MQKTVILCYRDSNIHSMAASIDFLNPVRGRCGHGVRWSKVDAEKTRYHCRGIIR